MAKGLILAAGVLVFFLGRGHAQTEEEGGRNGGWGRMWNSYGEAVRKNSGAVRASKPIKDWPVEEGSGVFKTRIALLTLTSGRGRFDLLAYESSVPGTYWVAVMAVNGEQRRGRAGALSGFRVYGPGGLFLWDGVGGTLSPEVWTDFLEAFYRHTPGARDMFSGAERHSKVLEVEVVPKVHPDPVGSRDRTEVSLLHVLKTVGGREFDMVDVSLP